MRENPFEPPGSGGAVVREDSAERKRGRLAFYAVVFLMLVPALYNYLEFDAEFVMGSSLPPEKKAYFRQLNQVQMVVSTLVLLFLGFALLERLSLLLRSLFAGHTNRESWQSLLYQGLYRAAILSIPGAVLWMVWTFCFYKMKFNFLVLSLAVGIPAHILGACVYVPLLYGWFRLARQ